MSADCNIIQGDALTVLRTLPSDSVHMCCTSPPYWGLRDYGVEGQLGLEKTPELYVARMVEVFREVRRVLREDGTCWCNLGDAYASSGTMASAEERNSTRSSRLTGGVTPPGGRAPTPIGLKPKDLVGIPWRLAFALQADGWWLRQDIIWHKPNPMPESVTDRCTKAHEYVFLLTKAERYFFDAEAIKENAVAGDNGSSFTDPRDFATKPGLGTGERKKNYAAANIPGQSAHGYTKRDDGLTSMAPSGLRNKRSVWTIPSEPYPESHFATFPTALVKPCILSGTSARGCCPKCGAPWERVVEQEPITVLEKGDNPDCAPKPDCWKGDKSRPRKRAEDGTFLPRTDEDRRIDGTAIKGKGGAIKRFGDGYRTISTGWRPTCECNQFEQPCEPCTVLDPFAGSGTVGQVALELGRKAVLIELNPAYVELARKRTNVTPGLQLA